MEVKLKRPKTLKVGQGYLWQENTSLASDPSRNQQVTFVSYDPCPAFAIVRDESGKRWRCPRELIFTLENIDQDRLFTALAKHIASSI